MSDTEIKLGLSVDEFTARLAAAEERFDAFRAKVEGGVTLNVSSGSSRSGRGADDSFNDVADARNYHAGRVGEVQRDLEGTPRSQERRSLYEDGFENQRQLNEVQAEYDRSTPGRGSRGARSIADIQEQAERENATRDARAEREADKARWMHSDRQAKDEAWHDRYQKRVERDAFMSHYGGGGGRGPGGGMFGPPDDEDDNGRGGRNPFRVGTRGGLSRGFFNASNQALEGLPTEGAAAVAIAAKVLTTVTEGALDQAHVLQENETHQRARREGGTYTSPEVEAGESRAAQAKGVDAFGRRIAGLAGGLGTSIYDAVYGDRLKEIAEVTEARGHADETRAHVSALTGTPLTTLKGQDAGLLPIQLQGAEALERFGVGAAAQFGRTPDGRYSGLAREYGVQGVSKAIGAVSGLGMEPGQEDIRDRLMNGEDVRDLAGSAGGALAARGDLNGLSALRPFLSRGEFDADVRSGSHILNLRGEQEVLTTQRRGAEADLAGQDYSGGRTGAGFDRVRELDEALDARLKDQIASIKDTPSTHAIREAAISAEREVALRIQQDAAGQAGYNNTITGLNNAVGRANTGVAGAGVSLFGAPGDFTDTLLPMEQGDLDAEIRRNQNIVSNPNFTQEQKLQAQAQIRTLQAQRMMLPAQAQQADINRFEEGMNAQRAETGLLNTTAGLYGDVSAIGGAGEAQRGDNARERQYLQSQLEHATSEPIKQQLRAQIARLNTADVVSYAGESSQQAGVERQIAGARQAQAGQDIFAATQYGDDADINSAYAGSRASRGQTTAAIQARLSDPHLSRDERFTLQRELLQQSQGQMQDDIAQRGNELSRMDTRHNLARGDTDFGVTQARALGSASDYRFAVGSELGELDREAEGIDAQLARGGLTFDQQASLTRKRQGLRSERFSTEQRGIDEGYQREDLENYDVERLGLSTRRSIAHKMPFGVGNTLALDMQQVGQNQTRLRQLEGRMAEESRGGNLSPQRRFDMLREESSLMEENAGIAGELSHGLENYLPNMSSGAPTSASHFNNLSLAARFGRDAGSLNGSYGFAGGQHAAGQQAAIQRMTEGVMGHTPMGGGNLPGLMGGMGGGSEAQLSQIAGILQRIEAKGGFGGNGTRASEGRAASNGIFAGEGDPGYGYMIGRGGHR